MATPNRFTQDAKRTKYIRALERFKRSVMGYLIKDEGFDGFCARVEKQKTFLDQVDAVELYKEEFQLLEQFVKKLIQATHADSVEYETVKGTLLHASNQLHKDKNRKKYRKDKHQKSKFNEWD